jgi:hypothetical protein
MSVARNVYSKAPYYKYNYQPFWGTGINGELYGGAASPTVAIVIGTATASVAPGTANPGRIFTSTDGKLWSSVATTSFGSNSINVILYGNNKFVAAGRGNTIATSPGTSGTTWTQISSPFVSNSNITYGTFQNNLFILTSGTTSAYSSDGSSWSLGPTISGGLEKTGTSQRGGIFYVASNPSTSRWIQVAGNAYASAAATQFSVFTDFISSASRTDISAEMGSRYPFYFPEDNNRLLIQLSVTTVPASNSGFHAPVTIPGHIPQLDGYPGPHTYANTHSIFFPYINSAPSVATLGSPGTPLAKEFSRVASTTSGSFAWYTYNEGYYNCIFVSGSTVEYSKNALVNMAFSADTMEIAEEPQLFGAWYQSAGNFAFGDIPFTGAFDFKFKGNHYLSVNTGKTTVSGHKGFLIGKTAIRKSGSFRLYTDNLR